MKKCLSITLSIIMIVMLFLSTGTIYAAETPEIYIQSIDTPVLTAGESNLFKFKLGHHGAYPNNIKGEGKGSVPRIIVSKYEIDVEEIKAGKSFTLDFTLQNTSSSASVSNIKVVVDSAESSSPNGGGSSGAIFFPAQGSNSFFIDSIGPKKTASNKIKLMTKQDIEPGVYPVKIRIEYDSNGVAQTPTEENISFPVSQEQRLDITGFTPPMDGMVGMPIPISFQYINKGKAIIYNFSIDIEGAFSLDGGDVYIGNLSAGYNDYFETSIIPNMEGEQKGALVFKYEDSQGNPKEQRTEFMVNVMGGEMGIPGTDVGIGIDPIEGISIDPVKKGSAIFFVIVVIVVVLAGAGVGAFFIIRKKCKAKKQLMLDEEV